MRSVAKAGLAGVTAVVSTILLGVAATFTAAFAFGATALIVPGTGTPNPNAYPEYVENARNYYLRDTDCGIVGECDDLGENLIGIDYPASFWPLTFIPGWCVTNCQKWDVSVADGVTNLEQAVLAELAADPEQTVVVYGHSQGSAVVSNTLRRLDTTLSDSDKQRVQIVMTGNVDNPAGGMWTRLGFLRYIPIIDLTLGLTTPTDTGITFTSIAMEYDGAANAPKYWGNLLSLANAVAGFAYLHGTTLVPDERTPPDGIRIPDYYPSLEAYLAEVYNPANAKTDEHGNTYIVVPSPVLPIVMPVLDIAARTGTTALVKPLVDLVSPVLRVLIDLGYDPNENPGEYSPLSLLPFSPDTDLLEVAVDLAEAVVQGIDDAINGGAELPAPPRATWGAEPRVQQSISPVAVAESAPEPEGVLLQSDSLSTAARSENQGVDGGVDVDGRGDADDVNESDDSNKSDQTDESNRTDLSGEADESGAAGPTDEPDPTDEAVDAEDDDTDDVEDADTDDGEGAEADADPDDSDAAAA